MLSDGPILISTTITSGGSGESSGKGGSTFTASLAVSSSSSKSSKSLHPPVLIPSQSRDIQSSSVESSNPSLNPYNPPIDDDRKTQGPPPQVGPKMTNIEGFYINNRFITILLLIQTACIPLVMVFGVTAAGLEKFIIYTCFLLPTTVWFGMTFTFIVFGTAIGLTLFAIKNPSGPKYLKNINSKLKNVVILLY
jgi:hypothetical protein